MMGLSWAKLGLNFDGTGWTRVGERKVEWLAGPGTALGIRGDKGSWHDPAPVPAPTPIPPAVPPQVEHIVPVDSKPL